MSDTYRCRLTNDWIPLPEPLLKQLNWQEGDPLELELVDGVIVVTRLGEIGGIVRSTDNRLSK